MIKLSFSKREKYILIATFAIIISALAYNFILEHTFKKWSSLNNEIVIKKTAIRNGLRLLETRNTIISEYSDYAVDPAGVSKILRYIEKKALSSEIKTANIRPRPVVQEELYKKYVIELQIEGEFSDINKFVSMLFKPPIFISLEKFDLRASETKSTRLKGTLILYTLAI
ncbi:MAG: type 4a pilus biogenesis protein PilO [Candidatus Omnitrophica bacterium]|nr:type 4a pilus biogenesis protein PilO [Candidatus Omnitrophota bacterium]MBU4589336.1 type 4a pilus biogenesis protein PilO [Candidatus Omnitrophota bacterium]